MKETKRLLKGFTIAEILISMIVISVIIAASASLITIGRLALGSSKDVQACVVKDGGNISSANCVKAILSCKYNLGKAYQSLLFFANGNTAASSDAAKTVLKETCRQGGSKACDYFIEQCVADSTKCDVSGSTNDLRYFLDLSSTDSSAGKTYIYSKVSKWYKDGITNIINAVNNSCESNGAGIACTIYLKQKTYNFDRSERAEFNEQDPINGTVFDSGIVKLLMPSGTLCAGYNGYGQLGNNATQDSADPVNVVGGHLFESIAAGLYYTCAIEKNTHHSWCWGYNAYGQLGNGTAINSKIPVSVKSVSGGYCNFISIITSTVGSHSCGIDESGNAWCWGLNNHGQLGDGTYTQRNNPVKVSGHTFTSIGTGTWHVCGLDSSGTAWCWGSNAYGQLGDGTYTQRNTPVKVVDAAGNPYRFTSISAKDDFTCGIDTTGNAWCWGNNSNGQLGSNANILVSNPVEVVDAGGNPYSFTYLSVDTTVYDVPNLCGKDIAGDIWCWGVNPSKLTAANGYNFTKLIHGYFGKNTFCALDAAGKAWCWGNNNFGQLGSGNNTGYSVPHAVVGNNTFSALSMFDAGRVLALDTSNHLWQWGGSPTAVNYPVLQKDTSGNPLVFKSISNGGWTALDMAGNAWSQTSKVTSGYVFDSITNGDSMICALDAAGNAYCWGTNGYGQLGSGNTTSYATPHAVVGGHIFSSIHSMLNHTCGIEKDTNYAYCWGDGNMGELGNGFTVSSSVPIKVVDKYSNPYTFSSIYSSPFNTCALDLSNHAWCWGFNYYGLGNGMVNNSPNPLKVEGGHTFISIALSSSAACGIDTSHDTWCWGYSGYGQLGYNEPGRVNMPSSSVGGNHKFIKIDGSGISFCALDTSNNLYCWGNYQNSQFGTGYSSNTSTPIISFGGRKIDSFSLGSLYTCGVLASGSTSTPISYWLSTTTTNHITAINKIISVSINQSTDNANAYIKWLVSFDNWATCKTWDSTNSVWVAAANCSASSAANTSDDIIQGLHDYEFASGAGSLDFKAVLYNTDGVTIPDIDQVVVNYY